MSASLSCLSATAIVDVVATILLSVAILRIVELILGSFFQLGVNNTFCMEVVSVVLLFPAVCLEVISVGFRSLSLGFRIFANVAAGHVLSDILLVVRYLGLGGVFTALFQFVFSYGIMLYEFLVACIQLGVFLSLISVYTD